jgi:hypothetical protein
MQLQHWRRAGHLSIAGLLPSPLPLMLPLRLLLLL